MRKPKAYIALPLPEEAEKLITESCDAVFCRENTTVARERLLREIGAAEGLLTSGTRIDNELLAASPALKVVSNAAVGYNNFDLDAMRRRGVIGTNTPFVLDDTVADLVLALMLAAARRIPELDRMIKEGRWEKGAGTSLFGSDVHHRVLGIVGMGRIGEAVAKRGRFGFDMDIVYHNRTRKPEAEEKYGARYAELEELLRISDFVVLLTPLTEETRGFFGMEQLRCMKPSAIFINASRGQTVRENELAEALKTGVIRAAGLDVFEREPVDPSNPLLRLPNVVTAPHIGSATAETRRAMAMLAAQNLVVALTGGTPPAVVPELKG